MKKEEAYEQYKARLIKLACKKTAVSQKIAEEKAQRQFAVLSKHTDLSNSGSLASNFDTLFRCLTSNAYHYGFAYSATNDFRDAFIQYLLLGKSLQYDYWHLVGSPDATRPDEDNLCSLRLPLYNFHREEFISRGNDIDDLLIMLGKLARNIKSPLLSRITQLMVDFDRLHEVSNLEEATRMVDDFIACFLQIKKEMLLLNEDEVVKFRPVRPKHKIELHDRSINTSGMTPAEATKASREIGREIYRTNMHDLIRPENAKPDEPHPMLGLVNFIKDMAENVKMPQPDDSYHPLDATLLSRVLGSDLRIEYENHQESKLGLIVDGLVYEDTEEERLREEIIDDLDRYLYRAADLAKTIGSRAYDDFVLCQSMAAKREWDFCDYDMFGDASAAADLKIFIDALERARPVLWADCVNYKPPKTTTPAPAKIDKGDSKIGKACSSFVTYFSKKEHVVKMRVKAASGPVDAPFKIISDDKLWSVISQLVSADVFPITLDNPWAPNKLNLKARFRPTKNHEDARHQFYKYIHCVGKGSKAMYELKVV